MILVGWDRRTVRDQGPAVYRCCPDCGTTAWEYLVTVRLWVTVLCLPLFAYRTRNLLLCPVCTQGPALDRAQLELVRRLNAAARRYGRGADTAGGYAKRVAPYMKAVVGLPADPRGTAARSYRTGTNIVDMRRTRIVALGPPPPGAPPRPMLRSHDARDGGWLRLLRIAAAAFIVAVVVAVALVYQPSAAALGSFLPGGCVSGGHSGVALTPANCTAGHDARIDSALTASGDRCPRGDEEFVPSRPNPPLCLDYSDHLP